MAKRQTNSKPKPQPKIDTPAPVIPTAPDVPYVTRYQDDVFCYLRPPQQQNQTGPKRERSRGVCICRDVIVSFWTNGQGFPVLCDKGKNPIHYPTLKADEHPDVLALQLMLSHYPMVAPVIRYRDYTNTTPETPYVLREKPALYAQANHLARVARAFLVSRGWIVDVQMQNPTYTRDVYPPECRPVSANEGGWGSELCEALQKHKGAVERALTRLRGHPYTSYVKYEDGAAIKAVRQAVKEVLDKRKIKANKNPFVDYMRWLTEDDYSRAQVPTTLDKHLTDKGKAVVHALCDRKQGHIGVMPRGRGAIANGLRLMWQRSQLKNRPHLTDNDLLIIRDRLVDDGLCQTCTVEFTQHFVRFRITG